MTDTRYGVLQIQTVLFWEGWNGLTYVGTNAAAMFALAVVDAGSAPLHRH